MIITSLYTYIAILNRKKFPDKKWFFPAFLFGLTIPDLDTLAIHFKFLNLDSSNTFGHSIISVLLIYLLTLITYEINKKNKYLNLANGIVLGMLLHIFLDSIISINSINIFWPLPFESINLYNNILVYFYLKSYLNIIVFLLFRYFFFFSIECFLNNNETNISLIRILSFSMKLEFFIIFIYIISIANEFKNASTIIFYSGYFYSTIIVYISILMGWNSYNFYDKNGDTKKELFLKEREMINLH